MERRGEANRGEPAWNRAPMGLASQAAPPPPPAPPPPALGLESTSSMPSTAVDTDTTPTPLEDWGRTSTGCPRRSRTVVHRPLSLHRAVTKSSKCCRNEPHTSHTHTSCRHADVMHVHARVRCGGQSPQRGHVCNGDQPVEVGAGGKAGEKEGEGHTGTTAPTHHGQLASGGQGVAVQCIQHPSELGGGLRSVPQGHHGQHIPGQCGCRRCVCVFGGGGDSVRSQKAALGAGAHCKPYAGTTCTHKVMKIRGGGDWLYSQPSKAHPETHTHNTQHTHNTHTHLHVHIQFVRTIQQSFPQRNNNNNNKRDLPPSFPPQAPPPTSQTQSRTASRHGPSRPGRTPRLRPPQRPCAGA